MAKYRIEVRKLRNGKEKFVSQYRSGFFLFWYWFTINTADTLEQAHLDIQEYMKDEVIERKIIKIN